jgi:hypothetical protein
VGTVDPVERRQRPIPLEVQGVVRVERLPTRLGEVRQGVTPGLATRRLNATPQRRRAHYLPQLIGGAFAATQPQATDISTRFVIPAGTRVEIRAQSEVWCPVTTVLSLLTENDEH